jgi:hypothetical protein
MPTPTPLFQRKSTKIHTARDAITPANSDRGKISQVAMDRWISLSGVGCGAPHAADPFPPCHRAACAIIEHRAPEHTDPPARSHYPDADNRRINDQLNNLVYSSRLPWWHSYLWQTLSMAMQELPHGFPLVQCGPFVSAAPPLRQELMNCLRASPLMPLACVLQSFIFAAEG